MDSRIKLVCASCGKPVRRPHLAQDDAGTRWIVGPECWRRIEAAGRVGYASEKSIDVLYSLKLDLSAEE